MSAGIIAVREYRGKACRVVVTVPDGRQFTAGGNRARRAAVAVVEYVPGGLRGWVSLRQDAASGEAFARSQRAVWARPYNVGAGMVVEVVPVADILPDDDNARCECGNTADSDGFHPCDSHGVEVEPVVGGTWDGLYSCGRCGRLYRFEGDGGQG